MSNHEDDTEQDPCATTQPADTRVATEDIGADGTWPMPPGSGPCRTWPLESNCGCLAPSETNTTEATQWGGAKSWTPEQQHAVEVATEILWRLTAGRFGLCKETVRPCRRGCDPCGTGINPAIIDGRWYNIPCPTHGTPPCGCTEIPEVTLPGPVYWEPLTRPPDWRYSYRPPDREADLETPDDPASPRYRLIVWIDGHVLLEPGWPTDWQPPPPPDTRDNGGPAQGQYWLHNEDRLVRIDGGSWPACQDMTRPLQPREAFPDEAAGTFGVQYWRGTPVPPGGRRAVAMLACELWKACNGDSSCRLPRRVQSLTREGVTYQMIDPTDYTRGGKVGLPEVDMWLATVNPAGVRSPSGVWSPDVPPVRSEWVSGGRTR